MAADPVAHEARNQRLMGLLHAAAQGRQAAFQELYGLVAPQLFAALLRILRRRDLAEEALQDALLNVWRNAASYSADKGAPMTWMLSICRYRALDMLRRERREVPLEALGAGGDDEGMAAVADESADRELLSKAEERALDECMGRLNDGQRASLKLAYFDGCTHEEIALCLKSPIGTVKSWVRRGLESLKRCLEAA